MLAQLLAIVVLAKIIAFSAFAAGPAPGQIKNLVTFGDSYTDVVSSHFVLSNPYQCYYYSPPPRPRP